jgi:hypothetical protein
MEASEMFQSKGLLGLSLLCALAFCAFGAANASAAGTTAFTCVPFGGEEDFEDPHCDNNVGAGNGEYGHVEIASGSPTTVTGTNNKTGSETSSLKMKGNIGGTVVEFMCENVHVHGTLTNNAGPPMKVTGTGSLTASECMLMVPAAQTSNCTVTVAVAGGESETVGMENVLIPMGEPSFTEVTVADAPGKSCAKALKGTFPVGGSAKVTGLGTGATPTFSGATLHFTTADTASTLTFAGHPAELEGTLTFKMAPAEGVEENPIVFTTE